MRFLVTGAFGYLAPRIVDWLSSRSHEVILGARGQVPQSAGWARRYEVRACDVLDASQVSAATRGVDALVHLASLDENEASRDPHRAMQTSVEGTRHVVAAAREHGARVVYMSTFHVYAPGTHVDEESPLAPRHPYGQSRLAAERVCIEEGTDVPCTILRLSNGYGAPMTLDVDRWTLAHNDFTRQALRDLRIVLKTPGTQYRDFVWVEDIAHAVEIAAKTSTKTRTFNVGSGHPMRIYDLALRVRDVARETLGASVVIERPEPQGDDPPPFTFAVERLAQLGFAPTDAIDTETRRLLRLLSSR